MRRPAVYLIGAGPGDPGLIRRDVKAQIHAGGRGKGGGDRPVYLDGRPHPSANAPHTWGGFSTGRWEGHMLTVTVTHLKEGYVRRNGLPRSDKGVGVATNAVLSPTSLAARRSPEWAATIMTSAGVRSRMSAADW